jgi:hypothetical protein
MHGLCYASSWALPTLWIRPMAQKLLFLETGKVYRIQHSTFYYNDDDDDDDEKVSDRRLFRFIIFLFISAIISFRTIPLVAVVVLVIGIIPILSFLFRAVL